MLSLPIGLTPDDVPAVDLAAAYLPPRHPTRTLSEIFVEQLSYQTGQHLPELKDVLAEVDDTLLDYCLVLSPVPGRNLLDFRVISIGGRMPGAEIAELHEGECYSVRLIPERVPQRLLELASCIVLKSQRLTETLSARRSTLNMRVYRGMFPVWHAEKQAFAIILTAAPPYVEL